MGSRSQRTAARRNRVERDNRNSEQSQNVPSRDIQNTAQLGLNFCTPLLSAPTRDWIVEEIQKMTNGCHTVSFSIYY